MDPNDAYEYLHIVHDEENRDRFWDFWKTVKGTETLDELRDLWDDFCS
jgi:hypothetical protein